MSSFIAHNTRGNPVRLQSPYGGLPVWRPGTTRRVSPVWRTHEKINLSLDEDFLICVEGVPVMNKAIAESISGLAEKAEEHLFKFAEFREQAAEAGIIIPYVDPLLRITHLLECINDLESPD